jgi:DNA-binding MurR/RpiR family transcriptional regulator
MARQDRDTNQLLAYDEFGERLAAAQGSLTPKMARVAAYVSEHYLQAAFLSTRELAQAAGVSHATVVRFPAALGYASFEALRSSIRDRVNFDLTGVERWRNLPTTNRSPAALLRRIIDGDIESLRALANGFSEPQLDRFVRDLARAQRVVILGFRFVRPLTEYLAYSLAKIKPDVEAFSRADSSLYDRIRTLQPGRDVVVAIGFARYPVELVKLARYAHALGHRVLALTDSPLSPLLPLADVALFAKASVLDFVGSLAAPAALINFVVSELGVRMGDQALRRLEALEEAARDAGIYLPGPGAAPEGRSLLAWREAEGASGGRDRG